MAHKNLVRLEQLKNQAVQDLERAVTDVWPIGSYVAVYLSSRQKTPSAAKVAAVWGAQLTVRLTKTDTVKRVHFTQVAVQ